MITIIYDQISLGVVGNYRILGKARKVIRVYLLRSLVKILLVRPGETRGVLHTLETPAVHDYLVEGVAESATHCTIQQKIDRIVDERNYIEQIAERHVYILVEAIFHEQREKYKNTLREFRDEKENAHDGEHESGAQIFDGPIALHFGWGFLLVELDLELAEYKSRSLFLLFCL